MPWCLWVCGFVWFVWFVWFGTMEEAFLGPGWMSSGLWEAASRRLLGVLVDIGIFACDTGWRSRDYACIGNS